MRPSAPLLSLLAVAAAALGCPAKQVSVPTQNPNSTPTVTLDIVPPSGKVATVTGKGWDTALPAELSGTEELSFSARCRDATVGCRNIEIFVDGTGSMANGALQQLGLPSPRNSNLDSAAAPGGSALPERLVTTKLDVGPLRGSFAMLRLDVSARATNSFGATVATQKVTLFWIKPAPLVMPNCPSFAPIGSPPPDLEDVHSLVAGMLQTRNTDPSRTQFVFAVYTKPGPGQRTFQLLTEDSGLPPNKASVKLVNKTGSPKSLLTVNGANCSAAGQLLQVPSNGSSTEALFDATNTTTLVLTDGGHDVLVWNEATFWLFFGGKRSTFTWLQ
ncbi:hypothetical protein FGE12_19570 [Aggregicoccus sp. 17bor-14]|uniref:hypothetical protein n=1 Tax=Myxococcaceae TaxID=31 RepID=UPI00129C7191|nr:MULTISPECIES: hypothetical protein [Myxococcaceae]MBF5044609.1 hypothetical protein [Simulacricoccus sp. 17bor-14]MRI90353.1 hypothetical protein [Aggregicoccus sp. 17bor-14]